MRHHLPALLGLALVLPLTSGAALAHGKHAHEHSREQGTHEHGAARLDVALAGTRLELQLEGAAFGFLGFEHAPEGPDQAATLEAARGALAAADALYLLPPAAGCTVAASRVEAELAGASRSEHEHEHGHGHGHGHGHAHEHGATGHQPTARADAAVDEHDHAHASHADWRSYHRFECRTPTALAGLELRLFEQFPSLERIDWQLVTDQRQDGGRLTRGQTRIALAQ